MGAVSDADKEALLALSLCFIFPSHLRSEAFGIALLEAARAGKPMITCEIGTGTTYVNVDRETGLTTPPANPVALADAMSEMWADRTSAFRWGENARARYEALFTAEKMARASCQPLCRATQDSPGEKEKDVVAADGRGRILGPFDLGPPQQHSLANTSESLRAPESEMPGPMEMLPHGIRIA